MKTKVDLDKFGSLVRITYEGYRVQIPWKDIDQLITDLKKEKKKHDKGTGLQKINQYPS